MNDGFKNGEGNPIYNVDYMVGKAQYTKPKQTKPINNPPVLTQINDDVVELQVIENIPSTPSQVPANSIRITMNQSAGNWEKNGKYSAGVNQLVSWLNDNPDFSIVILIDAGLTAEDDSWDDYPGWLGRGMTYEERVNNIRATVKEDIIRAGDGKIDGGRVLTGKGELKHMGRGAKTRVSWSRNKN